jgi:hypothetical protein
MSSAAFARKELTAPSASHAVVKNAPSALRIGEPNDSFEREADRIAETVTSGRRVPEWSMSKVRLGNVQRQTPEDQPAAKPNNYDEAANKLGEAFLKTDVGKKLTNAAKQDPLVKGAEDFVGTLPGKIIAGAAAASVVSTMAATHTALPVRIPEIPLDKIRPGLSVKITYEGPVDRPTKAMIIFSYSPKGEEKKPKPRESERYPAGTARIAAEQEKFRAGMTYKPGSPEDLQQKAEQKAIEEYTLHRFGAIPGTGGQPFVHAYPSLEGKQDTGLRLPSFESPFKPKPFHLLDQQLELKPRTVSSAPTVEEKKREEAAPIQRKAAKGATYAQVPATVHDVLRSSGTPLDVKTRRLMEAKMGFDFGKVRIHTDARAAASTQAIEARAYTVGRDVVFAPGQFSPHSSEGQKLLAHELVHTIQQQGDAVPEVGGLPISRDTAAGREADHAAEDVAAGGLLRSLGAAPVHALHRKGAFGASGCATGECEESKKQLHRKATNPTAASVAPPIIHNVLRMPDKPLETDTRAFMEPRFGHDFTQLDVPAAESAQLVNSAPYIVTRDVVSQSLAGRRVHVMHAKFKLSERNDGFERGSRGPLPLSQPGDAAERQANTRAAVALGSGNAPLVRRAPPSDYLLHDTPSAITDQAGRGRPLADAAYFEKRFGTQFGHVRVHDNEQAAALAEAADARAFTIGTHVFFNRGEYRPSTSPGRALLAHELAHIEQGHTTSARLWRQPKATVIMGEPEINPPDQEAKEEWVRLQVWATGMDHAAKLLGEGKLTFAGQEKRNNVFIGLHPKFVKVYDQNGKALGDRIALKEVKGLTLLPGVYVQGPKGLVALTISSDEKKLAAESKLSVVGQRPFTSEEKAAIAEEAKKAKAEGREPKAAPPPVVDFINLLTEPARFRSMVASVPNPLPIYFVPTYDVGSGKGGAESKTLYASPIEGRADGQPANAPPWPVSVDGPKLVPISKPTYSAKIDWTAHTNYSQASQVISQVGETINYRWELYDVTKYAKQQMAKDPAATKEDAAAKPEKSLDERIEDFKKSKVGTGTDVTGMGGANREFSREFEDWWKDTKRAAKGTVDPGGDTVREKLSNAAANRLSLELAPVALLTTAVGAVLRWLADLFAGPRQQQEVSMENEGIFLLRVITTPGINEDTEGKPVIRPPSVAAKVTEVTPMDRAVRESLDEPGAQLAELQSQIDWNEKEGNMAKAEYLRSLLAEAKLRFEGSPLNLLTQKRDQKQKELDEFRKNYPSLSDYSRAREVAMLNDQIALYEHHQKLLAPDGGTLQRVNATLISEVTGEQYPLLLSAGPMAMDDTKHQWMISDVTNREGDAFTGLGNSPSAAFLSALTKFGNKAAYGRGRIGVRTAGLGLEAGARDEFMLDSAPADWALAEKRIDDLVTTLAALGLTVASAGTASVLIGAGMAAARLIQRWQAGKLYLDTQTVSDALGLLGGLGAAGELAGGLRVQKFEKVFAITQEGEATEAQIAQAAEALKGAQQLAKAVEIANEAINYGGLLWGNYSFIDQMMSINEQERTGAITHAAARRARATAISSAVQNNALFIAGNVLKAKGTKQEGKPAAPGEKAPIEKLPGEDVLPEEGEKPAQKPGEPVPIGERQATPAELRAALPVDLESLLVVDDSLHGDTVKADYKIDPATGLISEIRLRCSPDARPASIALHAETIRTMQKYQGFSGRVRQAIAWVGDLIGFETLSPEKNPRSFEAALEIQKLPKLIEAQMARMKNMEADARDMAEAELESLQIQLDTNLRTLELGGSGEAAGFVAAKGLSKAKQKKYAELLNKLRGLEPGKDPHKEVRWEMYELIGGDLPPATWEKIYYANIRKAAKASAAVVAERERLGWGKTEQTIQLGKGEVRRLDIADVDPKVQKGVEVKAYETGTIYASEDIVSEVERDAKLVRRGWDITWVLLDTVPSGPLLSLLRKGNIKVELRTRKGGGESKLVTEHLPPVKSHAKATQ